MPRRRVNKPTSEANAHQLGVNHWGIYYPHVPIRTDYAAGLKLTMGQAVKHKAMQGGARAWPDFQAATAKGGYHGLFMEFKKDGVKLIRDKDARKILKGDYKLRKKGDWWDLHTEEQAHVLAKLRAEGYAATFAVGIEQIRQYSDMYMDGKRIPYVTVTDPTLTAGQYAVETSPF